MVGGGFWSISVACCYLCFYYAPVLGVLPSFFFSVFAFWPMMLFSFYFPDVFSGGLMPYIISLIGWLLLATIAASLLHILMSCIKRKVRDERPVA
jgi:hypothetical protein